MIKQELTYWVTLASIPRMWTKRKNEIYAKCYVRKPSISIIELFENPSIWDEVGLDQTEKMQFEESKTQLANNSFLVDELMAQGFDILPICSKEYPQILKDNLNYGAPTVIFTKGNKSLLQDPSIAIVGSRNADEKSLFFTDNIAKSAASSNKVVVSGFAKGVDRQALDSAVGANGKSIIVLPQGILTFSSGFKQYFKHIVQGRVLVMSSFAPKAPWSVELAMARNPIIYGMASEIFVAQSDSKGGTWSGVIDGLRKQRQIYVRYPEKGENNANLLLIQKGASAIDMEGKVLSLNPVELKTPEQLSKEKFDSELISILTGVEKLSAKEILERLHLDWTVDKMKRYLENMQQVEKKKESNRVYFCLKGNAPPSLFNDKR